MVELGADVVERDLLVAEALPLQLLGKRVQVQLVQLVWLPARFENSSLAVTHESDTSMSHTCRFRSLANPPPPPPRAALSLANCLPGQLMKTTIRLCCYPAAGHQSVFICYLAYRI